MESELAPLQWVHCFTHIQLLDPIGYLPPTEAAANYWRRRACEADAAAST